MKFQKGPNDIIEFKLHRHQSCSHSLPYYLSPEHLLIVVPEVSAGHPAVAVHDAATDGIMHGDHQALLGILRDAGRVDELLLRLLRLLLG